MSIEDDPKLKTDERMVKFVAGALEKLSEATGISPTSVTSSLLNRIKNAYILQLC